MTILVCGEALWDIFQTDEPAPGALSFDARVGGSPFNVAVGLARLGGAVSFLSGISTDALGDRLMGRLTAEGVSTSHVIRNGRRTTLSLVGLDASGSPDYAFYGVGSADCAVTPADLPQIGDDIAALHFGSYSLAVPPVADAMANLAVRFGGRFISVDPNVRPTIEPDMNVWRRRIDAMRAHADMIKVSAEDLEMLYPGRAPSETAQHWLVGSTRAVIVTSGGEAVQVFRQGETFSVAPPATTTVDTVGAGDSFQSALLGAIQQTGRWDVSHEALPSDALRTAVLYAARAAALTCSRRGADPPTAADMRALGT